MHIACTQFLSSHDIHTIKRQVPIDITSKIIIVKS